MPGRGRNPRLSLFREATYLCENRHSPKVGGRPRPRATPWSRSRPRRVSSLPGHDWFICVYLRYSAANHNVPTCAKLSGEINWPQMNADEPRMAGSGHLWSTKTRRAGGPTRGSGADQGVRPTEGCELVRQLPDTPYRATSDTHWKPDRYPFWKIGGAPFRSSRNGSVSALFPMRIGCCAWPWRGTHCRL